MRTDAERIQFLDACAATMRKVFGLEFTPFRPNDEVRNRHAWLALPRYTGCAIVAYKDSRVSIHVYSDHPVVVGKLRDVFKSAAPADLLALPGHMQTRLSLRPAPRNPKKLYLEFAWHVSGPLAGALPDVEPASRFFNAIIAGLG